MQWGVRGVDRGTRSEALGVAVFVHQHHVVFRNGAHWLSLTRSQHSLDNLASLSSEDDISIDHHGQSTRTRRLLDTLLV
ncbi:hypothetical protein GCM10010977_06940 [Citricoccus zhacaiensis]|uniref:Uncharacterized protein n=1 Tax=Citricoccus zhacaiensis TaxID=489142 RepID=A0ABQ2LQW0_9MICC|nr:hypothetical protein GCM10010977_06940 [Citricoccus zhacaiensis]